MAPKLAREVAVTRVAQVMRQGAQILHPCVQTLDGPPEPLVLAISMQGDAAFLAENPRKVPGRGADLPGDIGKAMTAIRMGVQPGPGAIHQFGLGVRPHALEEGRPQASVGKQREEPVHDAGHA